MAAVHAGWRGLMAGVVEETVAVMRSLGATSIEAALGPCIAPHAYRFSAPDLERVAARYGPRVVASDDAGYPALDLTEARPGGPRPGRCHAGGGRKGLHPLFI